MHLRRVWKIWIAFVGLFVAMPFLHEYIHAFTSITFGYPSWIIWNEWVAKYSFDTLPALWIRLVVIYSPELALLPLAAVLTWKFRNDIVGLMLPVPFLLISIVGFTGHAGYLG